VALGAMPEAELTEELIAAAMAKADARVCVPGDPRCYAFPYGVAGARATCTTKGRCKVGWVVRNSGRESWDVWLEVATGLVKLIPQANA
jgi:hypothetical protein